MEDRQSRAKRFVAWALTRAQGDSGFAARLRRADNPDTEYAALGLLCGFGVRVENDAERLAFATVGAALCRQKRHSDGENSLGKALRRCMTASGDNDDSPRFRRLLACDSVEELCRVLRPLLSLVASRDGKLCHASLLEDILRFAHDEGRHRVRLRWAQDFYGAASDADPNGPEEA